MKGVFEKKDNFGVFAKHIKGFRGFPPMFHPHGEIIYVVRGEINMMIDGYERTLKAGELSVVFPYVVHSYEDAPDAEIYMAMFEPESVAIFEAELLKSKPLYPYVSQTDDFDTLLLKAAELMKSNENDTVKLKTAAAYISSVIGELLCMMPLCDVESLSENMIKPILLYCSEHFTDEDISIKKIADELYISQSYVSKVFSTKLKYGFREYVNELRISKAKKLLSKTELKIVDVMLECGFKNQSSFNRIFSELCGVSPREYRMKKKGKD